MLTVINERIYTNGTKAENCPLLTMVGASNELPESKELEALFDRFLLRFWVDPINDRIELKRMLAGTPGFTDELTLQDIANAQAEIEKVVFNDLAMDTMLDVKTATEKAGVRASDRRWKKVIKALKAYAWICGDTLVHEDHFDLLPDMLWREPKERPVLVQVVGKVANPLAAKATEVLDAAKELYNSIPDSSSVSRAQFLACLGETNAEFERMENELRHLISENPGKTRRLEEATEQIQKWHNDTQRQAAQAVGIKF